MNTRTVPVAWRVWMQFKVDGKWVFTDIKPHTNEWGWEPLYAAPQDNAAEPKVYQCPRCTTSMEIDPTAAPSPIPAPATAPDRRKGQRREENPEAQFRHSGGFDDRRKINAAEQEQHSTVKNADYSREQCKSAEPCLSNPASAAPSTPSKLPLTLADITARDYMICDVEAQALAAIDLEQRVAEQGAEIAWFRDACAVLGFDAPAGDACNPLKERLAELLKAERENAELRKLALKLGQTNVGEF